MHNYLRSVGFHDITKEGEKNILKSIIGNPEKMDVTMDSEGNQYVELRREVATDMGIALRGSFDENDEFTTDYYFPYFSSNHISTTCEVEIIKQSDKESYQGLCDDIRLGVDLIFYLQDMFTLLQSDQRDKKTVDFGGVRLSGLSDFGKIILPMKKAKKKDSMERSIRERNNLLLAARDGDPKAMEKLTLQDMDTYSMIQRRLEKEDVLSIVTTYFMPSGIECDKYEILGEITGYRNYINRYTMQLLHVLTVECNKISIDVVINDKDLLGEPAVGRRFKGNIWLQGKIS